MALLPIPLDELQRMAQMLQQQQEDGAALLLLLHHQNRRWRRQRRYWVWPWIARRLEFGQYHTLMAELEWEHRGDFINYLHMDSAMFQELLQRLTLGLMKKDTNCRAGKPRNRESTSNITGAP